MAYSSKCMVHLVLKAVLASNDAYDGTGSQMHPEHVGSFVDPTSGPKQNQLEPGL